MLFMRSQGCHNIQDKIEQAQTSLSMENIDDEFLKHLINTCIFQIFSKSSQIRRNFIQPADVNQLQK